MHQDNLQQAPLGLNLTKFKPPRSGESNGTFLFVKGVHMKTVISILIGLIANLILSTTAAASVIGHIDSPSSSFSNSYSIRGWACQRGSNQSINVHIYVGGPAGTGQLFKGATANLSSESAVSTACQSSGRAYRFRVPMTHSEAMQHKGKAIYVYGISPPGSPNPLLSNSGSFRVATPPEPVVIGHIEGIVRSNGNYFVRGWSCQRGDPNPIRVHLYAGGQVGTGTAIRSVEANLSSNASIANACYTNAQNYRFSIPVTLSDIINHAGKGAYVHGISKNGTPNNLLDRSGSNKFANEIELSQLIQSRGTGDLEIPAGLTVNVDRSVEIGILNVRGRLRCKNSGNYQIKTDGILVEGFSAELSCGSPSSPFQGNLNFVLTGNRQLGHHGHGHHPFGVKAFVAHNGGTIRLHGKPGKEGFRRLSQHANPNDTSIYLDRAVEWQAGDHIVIASTSFDPDEAETFTITSITNNRRRIHLDRPISKLHWGQRRTYSNGNGNSWTLDQRAEVANLTRNIRISSPETSSQNKIGAHMMIAGTDSRAFIDNVEFHRVGQHGVLGAYPFHWHLMGNVKGQYIKNSSIHESYHRCITIHGTDEALVQRNTCYDHYGHGFFMELGNERLNTIEGNIGILSKRMGSNEALLSSESGPTNNTQLRYAGPATYWITNPANYIFNNVAAGSHGSGFWMSFKKGLVCNSEDCQHPTRDRDINVRPASENTLRFDNNRAHSSLVGITHDGAHEGEMIRNSDHNRALESAHYAPSTSPVFNNLVAYKNLNTGIYYRGSRATYKNAILADNGASAFFAYDQELIDTLIVGLSDNHREEDSDYYASRSRWNHNGNITRMSGVRIYDGPFYLDGVHFADFPESAVYGRRDSRDREITPTAFMLMGGSDRFVNQTKNLTFNPSSIARKVDLSINGSWGDSYTASILDKDGSLLGTPNVLLRPEDSMNHSPGCHTSNEFGAISVQKCNYNISQVRFSRTDYFPFTVQRILREGDDINVRSTHSNETTGGQHYNKFTMIMDRGYEYHVHHLPGNITEQEIQYSANTTSDMSPTIILFNVGSNCYLSGASFAMSASHFRSLNRSAYRIVNNDIHIKLRGDRVPGMRSELPHARSRYTLKCG